MLLSSSLRDLSHFNLDVLLLLGIALFGGTVGGRLFQKIKIPQVVGYIVIGIVVGQAGLNIVTQEMIQTLEPLNYFALGLIGFMIGGEIKKEVIQRYGRQFLIILFSEGLSAFFIVFGAISLVGIFFFDGDPKFWALAILLGAIASATAPAATTDVLWENKTRGPLTTTLLGIVAMDDALSLVLFAIASSIASKILGVSHGSPVQLILHSLYEIGISVAIGAVFGVILSKTLKQHTESERILAFSIGVVLTVLGLSLTLGADMLLAAMVLGAVVVNMTPRLSREIFKLVSGFTPPIYILFFVLIGAKLRIQHMSAMVFAVAVVYLVGRMAGKMMGAFVGARLAGSPKTVQRYLPWCLFSQAGVAIGLSIVAYHTFPGEIGNAIVVIITASTFVVQLIGPVATRFAVIRAGEVGLNITEEDLVKSSTAVDVMNPDPPFIFEHTPLVSVFNMFHNDDHLNYPVVDKDKHLIGIITVDSIKSAFMEDGLNNFILADDLKDPAYSQVSVETPLSEVREIMDRYDQEFIPVVGDEGLLKGFIERRQIKRFISNRIMALQKKSESLEV